MTKLELYRRLRGWKQIELAKAADLDKTTVCQTERRIRQPYPRARRQMAAALGVDERELFSPDGWPIEVSQDIMAR